MNVHDSERMRGMLGSLGYEEAESREEADLILFNTCSIRESADNRFIAHLGEAKRLKSEDPSRVVGVGGCWAQSVKDEVFQRFPFVDVAFGPGQIHKLAEFLNSDSLSAQGYFEFEDFSGHLPTRREREFQGWLQISQGCNCACSYCIVPSTRGREVSRDPGELIAEAEALAADGVREVTLLGQNVNSYGRDLPKEGRIGFAELLARVDAVEGIERIRYTSPHPKDMKEDVIRAHAELPALCEHIHLPLQSGSSAILKRMRRTYDRRPLHGPRRADPRARSRLRDHHRHHRRLPGRDRGRLRADARGRRGGRLRRRLHLRLLAAARNRGGDDGRTRCRTRSRSSGWSGWSSWSSGGRPSGRSASSGARWRCWSKGTSRTDETQLRGRTRHNKAVNFDGIAEPGELVEVEIDSATSQTLAGSRRSPARRFFDGPRDIRARRGSARPGSRSRWRSCCGSGGRIRWRSPATRCRSTRAWRRSRARPRRRSRRGSSTGWWASCRSPRTSRSATTCRWPMRRSIAALEAGRSADRGRGDGPLPAGRAGELSLVKAPPEAEDSELWSPETRHPTTIFGLDMDRALLYERIDARTEAIVAAGAIEEVSGPKRSARRRTARKALGFDELLAGDIEAMKKRSRNYARRQLTWMRKIPELHYVDRTEMDDSEAAKRLIPKCF